MAETRYIDTWLPHPYGRPVRRRVLMLVAQRWREQRVLLAAYLAAPDRDAPVVMTEARAWPISLAGTDPNGMWAIHLAGEHEVAAAKQVLGEPAAVGAAVGAAGGGAAGAAGIEGTGGVMVGQAGGASGGLAKTASGVAVGAGVARGLSGVGDDSVGDDALHAGSPAPGAPGPAAPGSSAGPQNGASPRAAAKTSGARRRAATLPLGSGMLQPSIPAAVLASVPETVAETPAAIGHSTAVTLASALARALGLNPAEAEILQILARHAAIEVAEVRRCTGLASEGEAAAFMTSLQRRLSGGGYRVFRRDPDSSSPRWLRR